MKRGTKTYLNYFFFKDLKRQQFLYGTFKDDQTHKRDLIENKELNFINNPKIEEEMNHFNPTSASQCDDNRLKIWLLLFYKTLSGKT